MRVRVHCKCRPGLVECTVWRAPKAIQNPWQGPPRHKSLAFQLSDQSFWWGFGYPYPPPPLRCGSVATRRGGLSEIGSKGQAVQFPIMMCSRKGWLTAKAWYTKALGVGMCRVLLWGATGYGWVAGAGPTRGSHFNHLRHDAWNVRVGSFWWAQPREPNSGEGGQAYPPPLVQETPLHSKRGGGGGEGIVTFTFPNLQSLCLNRPEHASQTAVFRCFSSSGGPC